MTASLRALLAHDDPDVRAQGQALADTVPEDQAREARGLAALDRILPQIQAGAGWLVLPPSMFAALDAIVDALPGDATHALPVRRDGRMISVGRCQLSASDRVQDIEAWSLEAWGPEDQTPQENWSFFL